MARRKPPPPRGPQLELAGELCVTFVNTAGARADNRRQGVSSFAELVTWSREVGIVSAHEAERLRRRAAERPAEAAFARAAKILAGMSLAFIQRNSRWTGVRLVPIQRCGAGCRKRTGVGLTRASGLLIVSDLTSLCGTCTFDSATQISDARRRATATTVPRPSPRLDHTVFSRRRRAHS